MKIFAVIFMGFMLSGCSMHSMIDKIPDAGFDTFEYRRTGNVTANHIKARNAIKVGDMLEIEDVEIIGTYPFVDFYIHMEGFKK